MGKPALQRVMEVEEKLVHFGSPGTADQVTLCGLTDWIGATKGVPTTKPVTCRACKNLVRHIHAHRKPRGL